MKIKPQTEKGSENDLIGYIAIITFIITGLLSIKYSFTGINNYLLENHSFRQTQTALTSFYFLKDGYKLDYETPIAGSPWVIPFEFPVYQFIVSIIKSISSGSLDLIGRLVSLAFYWMSLLMAFKITKQYTKSNCESLLIISFVLVHPIYIFWSRSFMIESTALFLSLSYIYFSTLYIKEASRTALALGSLFGVMAALTKVTTFTPYMLFLFLIIAQNWVNKKNTTFNFKANSKYLICGATLFLMPILLTKIWISHCDKLKSLNAYAYEFTSAEKLHNWNFGTTDQKLSIASWKSIFNNSQISNTLFYLSALTLLAASWLCKMKYRREALICFCFYLSAPIIFTNLHIIHDYYTYANSILLCLGIGFLVVSLISEKSIHAKALGLLYTIAILSFFTIRFNEGYYKVQNSHPNYLIPIASYVKENTKPDDVILVYGNDWGSEYAYYTERRTISLRNTFKSINDADFVNLMKQNSQYNINTLVIVTYLGMFDANFANELIQHLNFKPVIQNAPFFIFQKEKS